MLADSGRDHRLPSVAFSPLRQLTSEVAATCVLPPWPAMTSMAATEEEEVSHVALPRFPGRVQLFRSEISEIGEALVE